MPTSFFEHHSDIQQYKENMQLNMSVVIGQHKVRIRKLLKTTVSEIVLLKLHTIQD